MTTFKILHLVRPNILDSLIGNFVLADYNKLTNYVRIISLTLYYPVISIFIQILAIFLFHPISTTVCISIKRILPLSIESLKFLLLKLIISSRNYNLLMLTTVISLVFYPWAMLWDSFWVMEQTPSIHFALSEDKANNYGIIESLNILDQKANKLTGTGDSFTNTGDPENLSFWQKYKNVIIASVTSLTVILLLLYNFGDPKPENNPTSIPNKTPTNTVDDMTMDVTVNNLKEYLNSSILTVDEKLDRIMELLNTAQSDEELIIIRDWCETIVASLQQNNILYYIKVKKLIETLTILTQDGTLITEPLGGPSSTEEVNVNVISNFESYVARTTNLSEEEIVNCLRQYLDSQAFSIHAKLEFITHLLLNARYFQELLTVLDWSTSIVSSLENNQFYYVQVHELIQRLTEFFSQP